MRLWFVKQRLHIYQLLAIALFVFPIPPQHAVQLGTVQWMVMPYLWESNLAENKGKFVINFTCGADYVSPPSAAAPYARPARVGLYLLPPSLPPLTRRRVWWTRRSGINCWNAGASYARSLLVSGGVRIVKRWTRIRYCSGPLRM